MKKLKQVFLFCLLITLFFSTGKQQGLLMAQEIIPTYDLAPHWDADEFLYTILNSTSFLEWQESSKIMLPVALSDIKIDSNPVIVKVTLKN